jgi:hypothetical protein
MFNDQIYILKLSADNSQNGGYINRYFKSGENTSNWTESVTVTEYPNETLSPLEYAELIQSKDHSPDGFEQPVSRNRQLNNATFTYLLRGRTGEDRFVELNVVKAEPYKGKKGLTTLKYSKKYYFATKTEYTKALEDIEQIKQTLFNEMKETLLPPVVHETIAE